MRIFTQLFMLLLVMSLGLACSSSQNRKTLVFDPDGRSMRFENGRAESRNKRWNSDKSLAKQRKKRNKAFRKRKRH